MEEKSKKLSILNKELDIDGKDDEELFDFSEEIDNEKLQKINEIER